MIADKKLSPLAKKLNLPNNTRNAEVNKTIWIVWDYSIALQIISEIDKCYNMKISSNNQIYLLSTVYAKYEANDLLNFGSSFIFPWIVGGDFNIVTLVDERGGCSSHNLRAIKEFNEFIINSCLHDVGFIGSKFTWSKKINGLHQKWARLDRILINHLPPPDMRVTHLSNTSLDHSTLLIDFNSTIRPKTYQTHYLLRPKTFQSRNIWHMHEGF